MHLYQGSAHQFIADATQARLANQLSDRFFDEFRYRPAPSVIVELKQWTEVGRSNITACVTVDFGGRPRDHLHPSRQVAQYQRYRSPVDVPLPRAS